MTEKVVNKLEYLKEKITWPIKSIVVTATPSGCHAKFVGDANFERNEIFTDIGKTYLEQLLREYFPAAYGITDADMPIGIYRNGEKLMASESEEAANQIIRQYAAGDWEAIYSIRDQSGIIARYVCNSEALVIKLS